MATPKRNKAQRWRDLAIIADYALQGLNAQQIADKLNARAAETAERDAVFYAELDSVKQQMESSFDKRLANHQASAERREALHVADLNTQGLRRDDFDARYDAYRREASERKSALLAEQASTRYALTKQQAEQRAQYKKDTAPLVRYTLVRNTVARDMEDVNSRYLKQAETATGVRLGEHYRRLLARQGMYAAAWQRSQEDAVRQRRVKTDTGQDKLPTTVDEAMQENRVGDIRFLEGMLRIDDKIAALFGLNAPTKVAFTDPTGRIEGVAPDDAVRARVLASLIQGLSEEADTYGE